MVTYRESGVSIEAGNSTVDLIKKDVRRSFRPEVLTDLGSFAGLFALDTSKYTEPVLVSGTDGVGTKLRVAMMADKHDTIGIDAVAMCVNDILVQGAEPLFFLDYVAVGKLSPEKVADIVHGVVEGCIQAGCVLIGGETAEMPGFYGDEDYDIAGFAVGAVNKSQIINGQFIKAGDTVIGIPSSGLHSNGFSLVRKILFEMAAVDINSFCDRLNATYAEVLLTPTRIYVKELLPLCHKNLIKGMAHITGGGLTENIPRILPKDIDVVLDESSWTTPEIFNLLKELGEVPTEEMRRVFNMGIGMVVIAAPENTATILAAIPDAKIIGQTTNGNNTVNFK